MHDKYSALLFLQVKTYLVALGLQSDSSKGLEKQVGLKRFLTMVVVNENELKVAQWLRFLGVMITADGRFAPWWDIFDKNFYDTGGALHDVSLGNTQSRFTHLSKIRACWWLLSL